ncbi:MAG: hypothetical protein A07HR60_01165 [uncultured archaeon A07HR60]|nr:MAG: hypothetical protein A07HR60_01165 [uncultured archaeon A07HR60]
MAVREPTCDKRVSVLTAHQKQDATPDLTPQTPADVPVATITLGRQSRNGSEEGYRWVGTASSPSHREHKHSSDSDRRLFGWIGNLTFPPLGIPPVFRRMRMSNK